MFSKKILVTGASGLLGYNLCRALFDKGYQNVLGQFYQSENKPNFILNKAVNLTDPLTTKTLITHFSPDVIINCAALTKVDLCETNQQLAFSVNSKSCENLISGSNHQSTRIIHISTDQLWDGTQKMVTEETKPSPLNIYGLSKLAGENNITQHLNHLILRTNFFGGDLLWRQSFIGWLDSQFQKNISFFGFEDVFYTPIGITSLIDIIIQMIPQTITGIYHAGGAQRLSKYEFATLYAKAKGYNDALINKAFVKESNLQANRPTEMSLDSSKLESVLNITLPNIEESFSRLLIQQ